jgi:serine protease inhibitor
VSQEGVHAIATTAVIGAGAIGALEPIEDLLIDRPFYFAITDDVTQTILFAGRFVHP